MGSASIGVCLSDSTVPVSGDLRGNAPSATDDDHNQSALLGGWPIPSCSNIPSPTDCSAAENVTIGDQESMIFNSAMDKIVLLFHGWDFTCVNQAENYCDLAVAISELGYQVVLPRGNSGPPTTGQIPQEVQCLRVHAPCDRHCTAESLQSTWPHSHYDGDERQSIFASSDREGLSRCV